MIKSNAHRELKYRGAETGSDSKWCHNKETNMEGHIPKWGKIG